MEPEPMSPAMMVLALISAAILAFLVIRFIV